MLRLSMYLSGCQLPNQLPPGPGTSRCPCPGHTPVMRTHVPEDNYLRKLGLVVELVASVEGLLIHAVPQFQHLVPPELNLMKLSGMTTHRMGEYLVAKGKKSTDPQVAAYFVAGGKALVEIAPQRNAMLHARPVTDGDDPEHRIRLLRWRVEEGVSEEVHLISDDWLDRLVERIDDIQVELNAIRPPLGYR
jgi:hypothetical protein